jgi:hypothetical protein
MKVHRDAVAGCAESLPQTVPAVLQDLQQVDARARE